MSNFTGNIKHPITGEKVKANFMDNYFGDHEYGVVIVGSADTDPVYRMSEIERLPEDEEVEEFADEETVAVALEALSPTKQGNPVYKEKPKYKAMGKCTNCNYKDCPNFGLYTKGVRVSDYLCPNCGCMTWVLDTDNKLADVLEVVDKELKGL